MLSSWKSLLSLALAACGVVEAAVLSTRVRGEVGEINGLDKRQGSGKVQIGYFANWGVYSDGRNFQPNKIDTSALTHILYSFLDADPNTGSLIVADSYADLTMIYPGDTQAAGNVYGAVKQVYLLKKQKRTLKTILSIGGWTYSQNGHFGFVTNASLRAKFVADCVKYLEDWGMDGIDIDFEYPTAAQKSSFSALINELRAALTAHMNKKGESNPYLVSIAVPAGQTNWVNFDVPAINGALSYWNLMAYDYAGGWDKVAGDQANVYGGVTGFSTEAALNYYLGSGATPSKIALGIPIYGRAFANTAGMYQAFSGLPAGTWEAGIYDYKALPRSGAQVFENSTTVASYSYSSSAREVVSYDTPAIVTKKVAYALSKGLGGCMYWELSADKTGTDSLVRTAAASLGSLDTTQNHLSYPGSIYENIRNNMGNPVTTTSTSTTTTTTTTTTTRTTTTTPPTTTPGTGGCAGVAAWSSAVAYTGGQKVTYGGHLWTAKWWTQADTPGGAAGVWNDGGAC